MVSLVACAPTDHTPNHTTQGVIAGMTTGILVGGLRKGNSTHNAARGAIIGAATGGLIGSIADHQRALRKAINDPNVSVSNDGRNLVVVFPDTILFDTSSAKLAPAGQRDLQQLAGYLQDNPQSRITIIGHTDSTGSLSYNQTLSEHRARAVSGTLLGPVASRPRGSPPQGKARRGPSPRTTRPKGGRRTAGSRSSFAHNKPLPGVPGRRNTSLAIIVRPWR